jgi:malonyl CoA-acyl carrier protein transacylase
LSENYTAFIFPAFASDYNDHPARDIPGFNDLFNEFLGKATVVDPELAGFRFAGLTFSDDELKTQYITYIYSCAASSLIRRKKITPVMTAGYSMGIYASLFDACAVTFETGLEMIRIAFQSLCTRHLNHPYSMGILIGLDARDIQQLIGQYSLRIEITNQNAAHSFVVSGYRNDIQQLNELAMNEGALHVRDLAVTIPYHSSFLEKNAREFALQVNHLEIKVPETPIISLIDQVMLSTPDAIREELTRNLYHPLHWMQTMDNMLEKKVSRFIECGNSNGLARNARFIEGNYRFDTLNAIVFPSILP